MAANWSKLARPLWTAEANPGRTRRASSGDLIDETVGCADATALFVIASSWRTSSEFGSGSGIMKGLSLAFSRRRRTGDISLSFLSDTDQRLFRELWRQAK